MFAQLVLKKKLDFAVNTKSFPFYEKKSFCLEKKKKKNTIKGIPVFKFIILFHMSTIFFWLQKATDSNKSFCGHFKN